MLRRSDKRTAAPNTEGNFRVNEPNANASLEFETAVKILWIDDSLTTAATSTTTTSSSTAPSRNQSFAGRPPSSSAASSFAPADEGLRSRLLAELKRHSVVPLRDLRDAFPPASEYYNEKGSLRFAFEVSDAATFQRSRWENVMACKRIGVVLTIIHGDGTLGAGTGAAAAGGSGGAPSDDSAAGEPSSSFPSSGHSGGANELPLTNGLLHSRARSEFAKTISDVKQLFSSPLFSSSLHRCIVVDPDVSFASQLDSDMFLTLRSCGGALLSNAARGIMHDLGSDVVHHINSRILSLAIPSPETVASFRTVQDKTDLVLVDGNAAAAAFADPKGEMGRNIRARSAKRKGDLLLQLNAVHAAMISFSDVITAFTSSSTVIEPLWVAATLESIAAARYLEGSAMLLVGDAVKRVVAACHDSEALWTQELLNDLNNIELHLIVGMNRLTRKGSSSFSSALTASSAAAISSASSAGTTGANSGSASSSNAAAAAAAAIGTSSHLPGVALPTFSKQRHQREIEEPLTERMERLLHVIASIRAVTKVDVVIPSEEMLANGLPRDFRDLYDSILGLWFDELELYLVEAYHQYKALSPRLFELEAELYLKLARVRVEQRQVKKLLEALSDLNKTMKFVSPEAQLRVARKVPQLCYACGCKRKAVFMMIESAMRDKRAENFGQSLRSLLRAGRWCGVPLKLDPTTGMIVVMSTTELTAATGATPTGAGNNGPSYALSAAIDRTRLLEAISGDASDDDSPLYLARFHVTLLLEMLQLLKDANVGNGLRCHVASATLFLYAGFMDKMTQQTLMNILRMESATLPPYLPPTVAIPPLLKGVSARPLEGALRPQVESLGRAIFTYIDRERQRLTVLCYNGVVLQDDVVWVCGNTATVVVTLVNPFRMLLQLTTVSLLFDDDSIGMVTPYSAHGVMLEPDSTLELPLLLLPLQPTNSLRIRGVEVAIGQLEFSTNIAVPLSDHEAISVPVMEELPMVQISFDVHELEMFAGQVAPMKIHVQNVGNVPIDKLELTVHSSSCQLSSCEGCRQRQQSPSEVSVVLGSHSLEDSLPLGAGECCTLDALIAAPHGITDTSFQHLIFRIDFSPNYDAPAPPPNVKRSVPVFCVVPRRRVEGKLRLFTIPSLQVSQLSLSLDRRFVEIRVRNLSQRYTIELVLSKCSILFPNSRAARHTHSSTFLNTSGAGSPGGGGGGSSSASSGSSFQNPLALPGADFMLPLIEISTIPEHERQFQIPWFVREHPTSAASLTVDLADLLQGIYSTEPLEELVLMSTFSTSSKEDALLQNWISLSPPKIPVTVPAVSLVSWRLCVNAPWRATLPLEVVVRVVPSDVGMVSGLVQQSCVIGQEGQAVYENLFDVMFFKTGDHMLAVTLTDPGMRLITHHIRIRVEHQCSV